MQLQKVDLQSQAYKRDPYPTLARLIEQGPLVRIRFPLVGKLLVATTYEAVNELLRDRHTFVREPRSAGMPARSNLPWWFPRFLQPLAEVMINRDEPDHRRLRTLVEQAFLRQSIDRMRPRLESLFHEMLDDLAAQYRRDGRPVDLVANLARPFPLAAICELLGLPHEDRQMFMRQAEALTGRFSLLQILFLLRGMWNTTKYIREQIRQCRTQPREGLISELIAVEQEGDRLSEDEMVAMIVLLLLAGHVTTVHLIGGGVLTLLQRPDARQTLAGDWSLVESAVDEMLRYNSPVQATKPMMPAHDLVWHGVPLKRGEKMLALLAAANVDPHKFERPCEFDIRRSPNPHVAFGAGIHVCLGMKLAKAEAEIAIQQLFTRFPNLELAGSESDVRWSRHPGTRGPESLLVRGLE
jgi:cytochrome P450